jgi:hypothetical protein
MLKINFKKLKIKYYFNIFLNKKNILKIKLLSEEIRNEASQFPYKKC